tara:strand:+ start:15 stop:179 length:165 start_codon:yes stop_codon:yes gene_type:complete
VVENTGFLPRRRIILPKGPAVRVTGLDQKPSILWAVQLVEVSSTTCQKLIAKTG